MGKNHRNKCVRNPYDDDDLHSPSGGQPATVEQEQQWQNSSRTGLLNVCHGSQLARNALPGTAWENRRIADKPLGDSRTRCHTSLRGVIAHNLMYPEGCKKTTKPEKKINNKRIKRKRTNRKTGTITRRRRRRQRRQSISRGIQRKGRHFVSYHAHKMACSSNLIDIVVMQVRSFLGFSFIKQKSYQEVIISQISINMTNYVSSFELGTFMITQK